MQESSKLLSWCTAAHSAGQVFSVFESLFFPSFLGKCFALVWVGGFLTKLRRMFIEKWVIPEHISSQNYFPCASVSQFEGFLTSLHMLL